MGFSDSVNPDAGGGLDELVGIDTNPDSIVGARDTPVAVQHRSP